MNYHTSTTAKARTLVRLALGGGALIALLGCGDESTPDGSAFLSPTGTDGMPGGSGSVTAMGTGTTSATGMETVAGTATAPGSQGMAGGAGGAGPLDDDEFEGMGGMNGGPVDRADCSGDPGGLLAPKRVVRLTLDQINYSIRDFVSPVLAEQLAAEYELNDPYLRQFPAHLGEGHLVSESLWSKTDGMAQAAGQYVHDNFATVTSCAPGDAACATTFVMSFAEKAARRPLTAEEQAQMQQVVTEVQGFEATAEEVAEYGVYAALSSPLFQYRTELGTDPAAEEMLAPYELATMLSYFITGAPPDAALLTEAAAGNLSSPDALRAQAERLLATPAAREYLQTLMLASFSIPNVYTVVLTDPAATQVAKNSMVLGSRLFINDVLWSDSPMNELLTSQTAYVNEVTAPLYGVSLPATTDADGFGQVQLPADRAGLLTDVGYLTSTARPDFPSVVGRGVKVVDEILCAPRPPFPENLAEEIESFNEEHEGTTEREKMEARFGMPLCAGCHTSTDPYGMALYTYDEVGRYRTTDPEGQPIDASVTLPQSLGSQMVTTSAEMARAIADSGAFMGCVAGNLMEDSIGEGTVLSNDCAAQAVLDAMAAGGSQTFSDLVREVSASRTMTHRRGGN